MHTLKSIEIIPQYKLKCYFTDNRVKEVDLSSLLHKSAFEFLKNSENFYKIKNKHYFVEWEGFDADLSADTLWHWNE